MASGELWRLVSYSEDAKPTEIALKDCVGQRLVQPFCATCQEVSLEWIVSWTGESWLEQSKKEWGSKWNINSSWVGSMKRDWDGLQEILEGQEWGQGPFSLFSLFICSQEPFPPRHTCRPLCLPCCSSLWLHSELPLQSKHSPFFLATDTSPIHLSLYLRLTWRLSCFYMEWGWIGFLLFIRSGAVRDPETYAAEKVFLPPLVWIDRYETFMLKDSLPSQLQVKGIIYCLLQDTLVGNCLSLFMLCKLLTVRYFFVRTNFNQSLSVISLCQK